MKQFVVIGLGTFGFNVAVELAKHGHQVLAIDNDKNIVEEIKNNVTEAVTAMNELRGKVYSSVGATEIIYPEKESALRLANKLSIPTLIDQIPLAPEYSIFEIALPDGFAGKSIREINIRQKYGVTIIAIKNILEDKMIVVPPADHIFVPDSALIVLGKHSDINKLERFV